MTPTNYLRSCPNASTKEVMQACGCSRRAVRHAQEQLRLEQGNAPSYAKPLLALSTLLVIGLAAYGLWPTSSAEQSTQTSKQVQAHTEGSNRNALQQRGGAPPRRLARTGFRVYCGK